MNWGGLSKLSCSPGERMYIPVMAANPRISTPDPKPDLQYDGLGGHAERAGLQVVGDFCDHAISGRRKGRPQLGALMTSVRNRQFDCVLVWIS